MHRTNLRKVGGSVMLAVPPAILEMLHLQPGSSVGIAVDGSRLVVETKSRPRYKLEELLSQCDASVAGSPEGEDWTLSPAVGGEL
jgi:antitoxin ChpS